ncbi:hypothetical protein GCG54_00009140 [Colletotrichum gloeosporioides]|uniref:Fucose-specific lectin n=2 Tax=Colletotrichum gloeosporioides TaxID=474922 RepID=T0L1I3_COLGC|nr:uncharacterized protein GCG54_00009140 [Colletotrichum gloeosporioides]EQB58768.1 hypothetical protein CGLO_00936 [Colletotrichum gloeosporioides Cg-14]KAF3797170.1 hypothetical protein GCG54_00009140 [Colletotrichum gloeosporioides]
MARPVLKIVLGAMLFSPATCLMSWWTELSPQIAMQDPTTLKILHSACNSNSTPIFPTDGKNAFDLQKTPRNGSALAGAGWYDTAQLLTMASIFYQTEDGSIINGYFECDMSTGLYDKKGEYTISSTANVKSIHDETGLAVELLGSENGYRVFFHDEDRRVNVMAYTTKDDWRWKGRISQDQANSTVLTSTHSGQLNMSVVFPKDSETLEISRYFKDETWHLATLPRTLINDTLTNNTDAADIVVNSSLTPNLTLAAWPTNLTHLVASVDGSYVRSLFYLGTDSELHQISNINGAWTMMSEQDERLWPVADEAGGALTATNNFDTNEVWLWYRSNSSWVQLYHGTDGLWTQASVVPSFNATKTAENDPNGTSTASSASAKPAVLSTGAKAGIGVGVTVGVIGFAAVVALCCVRKRRQQRALEEARLKEIEAANGHTSPGNSLQGSGGVGPYTEYGSPEHPTEKLGTQILEADATQPPQELDVGEVYELVGEGHLGEMDATGQNGARRSIGGWREAQEER